MSNSSIPEQPIDPEVMELLNLIRNVPERNSNDISHSRERYLAQLNSLLQPEPISFKQWLILLISNRKFNQNSNNYLSRKNFVYSFVLSIIVVAVIVFSGAGVTAYAAQSALPGDALYAVKTGFEDTRIRLAKNAAAQAQLHIKFAENRLDELSVLVKERRYSDIEAATNEFEFHVNEAIQALQIVSAGDPLGAQELAADISNALSRYVQVLLEMTAGLPESAQESILRAINISRSASQTPFRGVEEYQIEFMPLDGGNDNTNFNGYDDEGEGGYQSSGHDAGIGDDGENENESQNHNTNTNVNANQNDHENDDRNGNSNDYDDDRENYNNTNNGRSNDNDDDHDSGSNDNSRNDNDHNNDNHNRNDDDPPSGGD